MRDGLALTALTESDWHTLKEFADNAERSGDYDGAESLWFAALHTVEFQDEADPRLAATLDKLAQMCFCLRKYSQAENLYHETLAMKEKHLGGNHISTAVSLRGLASVYYEMGRYEEAMEHGKRALEIFEMALGAEHMEVYELTMHLAALCHKLKNTEEADRLYKRAVEIKERNNGANQLRVVSSLSQRSGKPPSTCPVCGRSYSGITCLKCTQTKLQPVDTGLAQVSENV
ncbi:MAG TPA: tetratricopeptide repeat protein [Chroococcales cyanobacterium]